VSSYKQKNNVVVFLSFNHIAECFDGLSLLYQSQTEKHVPCCHNIKPKKKGTNERASEYDISVAFIFPAVTISKIQHKMSQSMAMLWSVGI
jgi:hypothetical protein